MATGSDVGKRALWRRRPVQLLATVAVLIVVVVLARQLPNLSAWARWGLVLDHATVGTPVALAGITVRGLERGAPGTVEITANAVYSRGGATEVHRAALDRWQPSLFLVGAEEQPVRLEPEDGWSRADDVCSGEVMLPEVPDGDYVLRAVVDTPIGEASAELPLALYRPALVHLVTDRPIYQPGQEVRFRAVTFRQGDLVPIEDRPGTFSVRSPEGHPLLDESVPTGPFGVAAATFPLADSAPHGGYEVTYRTGEASDRVSVRVEPFRLPRLQVEARAGQAWYTVGERPQLRGSVRYRSGAPVAGARVEVRLGPQADDAGKSWPPPHEWEELEPLTTDAQGSFSLVLGPIPDDLTAPARVNATVTATDPAGQRASGAAVLALSPDPVVARVETELADGLVPDFNNRVYIRVTTPDGGPLPGAEVEVRRAWDPTDPGVSAFADLDSVAALQLDPGQPVSVVEPPPPHRPSHRDRDRLVERSGAVDLFTSAEPPLDEQVALDGWVVALEPCAWLLDPRESERRQIGVALSSSGNVTRVYHEGTLVDACLAERMTALNAPPGDDRLYRIGFRLNSPSGSQLQTKALDGIPGIPEGLRSALDGARRRARSCIASHDTADTLPQQLLWETRPGSTSISGRWRSESHGAGSWTDRELSCVQRAFDGLQLDDPPEAPHGGVLRLTVQPDPQQQRSLPSARVRTAYELAIRVALEGREVGETTVVLDPGHVPALRLRPEQAILAPGDELRVRVLRGPDFTGDLPGPDAEIPLLRGGHTVVTLQWDADERVIHGQLPDDTSLHGLLYVELNQRRAVLLVPRRDALELTLATDQAVYRPGDIARLSMSTTAGGAGCEAAVGLLGVDEALGQVVSLPGPDEMARVTIRATSRGTAFGQWDAEDLLTGRIHGENAALATLQRIQDIPTWFTEASTCSGTASGRFDPVVPLTETFYDVLADVQQRVTSWMHSAPPDQVMTCERMVDLWNETLDDRRDAGQPVADAYGIELQLERLPRDLLSLADPRMLVSDARRLPEDVENWVGHVQEVSP